MALSLISLLKIMKPIEDYTQEELVALYKRMNVNTTTWWFKHYKMYDKYYKKYLQEHNADNAPIILREYYEWKELNPKSDIVEWADYMCPILFSESSVDNEISLLRFEEENNHVDNSKGIQKLSYKKEAYRICWQCIYWFGGLYDKYVNDYPSSKNKENLISPEEIMENLHMEDDLCVMNGRATDYQVYEFVWETLQWLSVPELSKLLKFAEKGIINKWKIITSTAGRKSRKCEIKQIDIETGEVVGTCTTRKELIDKTGISKSHLAQCIKTSKENPGNRNEWKKWKGNNGKLYGFVEVQ